MRLKGRSKFVQYEGIGGKALGLLPTSFFSTTPKPATGLNITDPSLNPSLPVFTAAYGTKTAAGTAIVTSPTVQALVVDELKKHLRIPIYDQLKLQNIPTTGFRNNVGVVKYGTLPDRDIKLWGDAVWPVQNPIPSVSHTRIGDVINVGDPSSARDPWEFLRSALVASDWNSVQNWYAFWYHAIYARSGLKDTGEYYGPSQVNLVEHKYIIDNGVKKYVPFSDNDLIAFVEKIWKNFIVVDLGSHVSIGFPYPNILDGGYDVDKVVSSDIWSWANYYASMLGQSGDQSKLIVGWISAPDTDWVFPIAYGVIIGAITWGAGTLIGSALAGPVGATGGTAAGGTATAVGGATATATGAALTTSTIPEIVITATAPALSTAAVASVGAGLATGAVVATSAPALSSTANSALTTQPIQAAPPMEEVVISSSAATPLASSAASVGAGLAAGTVVATATAPAISNATTATPDTPPIEEVVVEGTPITQPPAILTPATAAAITAGAAAAITIPGSEISKPTFDTEDSWKSKLEDLSKQYGIDYTKSNLPALLSQLLGHKPSNQEFADAQSLLDTQSQLEKYKWPILLLLGGVGVYLLTDKKKGHTHHVA